MIMTNMLDGYGLLAFPNVFLFVSNFLGWFFYVHYVYVFSLYMLRFFSKNIPHIPLTTHTPILFYPHFIIEEAWLVQEDVGWIAIAIFLEA